MFVPMLQAEFRLGAGSFPRERTELFQHQILLVKTYFSNEILVDLSFRVYVTFMLTEYLIRIPLLGYEIYWGQQESLGSVFLPFQSLVISTYWRGSAQE